MILQVFIVVTFMNSEDNILHQMRINTSCSLFFFASIFILGLIKVQVKLYLGLLPIYFVGYFKLEVELI